MYQCQFNLSKQVLSEHHHHKITMPANSKSASKWLTS